MMILLLVIKVTCNQFNCYSGNLSPDELVEVLRKEVKKEDGDQERVLQASKINKDALFILIEQLDRLIFRGKINFKTDDGKKLMKKFVISFFIPVFSSILDIKDDRIFWKLMEIVYKILTNTEKVLTEEEYTDVFFRICNGRKSLKLNGKLPFSEEVRATMLQHSLEKEKEIGESSAAVFLKRLGSIEEDLESRLTF